MEARECVLNLAQKVSVKIELNDDSTRVDDPANRNDVSTPRSNVQESIPSGLPLSSCKVCKRETPEETFFGVSLASVDEESGCDKENVTRRKIRVEAKQFGGNREKRDRPEGEEEEEVEEEKIFVVRQSNRLQIRPDGFPAFLCVDGSRIGGDPGGVKRKIPRPANAFMLFANEWRKKLAAENPRESNKDISVRLGILWKNMTKDVKEKYFALAREVDAEHKRKYPSKMIVSYIRATID